MVQVQERGLGSFQQKVLPFPESPPQKAAGLDDVRGEALPLRQVVVGDAIGLHGKPVVHLRQDQVLLLEDDVQLLPEDLGVRQILHPEPDPGGLVCVGRPDPPLGGAQAVLAQVALGELVQLQEVGHHQVGIAGDEEARGVDAPGGQRVHLLEEGTGVDHHPVPDHAGHMGVENPGRDQVELEELATGHHGVAGVVSPLVSNDEVGTPGQEVGDLSLPFVPPLGAHQDRRRHAGIVPSGAIASGRSDRTLPCRGGCRTGSAPNMDEAYRSIRNLIRTCGWYSLIWSPSTVAEVSRTSMPSTPRSVLLASVSAWAAASRQDSVDTPTRSIVLMTAIRSSSLGFMCFPRRNLAACELYPVRSAELYTSIIRRKFSEICLTAVSRSASPSRWAFSASHQIVRPMANPMYPGTPAPCRSQWITASSSAPRPRTTQDTWSRPPRRAVAAIRSQSSLLSIPSIFQTSGSTPPAWQSSMLCTMSRGRTSLSYRSASPPTASSCDGSDGTRSSNRNFLPLSWSQSDSFFSRTSCVAFISRSPS